MNALLLITLGLGSGPAQGPAPVADYSPIRSRTASIEITYDPTKRKDIQVSRLLVSRDKGLTWELEDTVTPDKSAFNVNVKEDGIVWVKMQTIFTNGAKDPPDSAMAGPNADQKLMMDGTPPVVRILSAKRNEDDVTVTWAIDEKFPSDTETKVSYRAVGAETAPWQDVAIGANRTEAKFKIAGQGAIAIRVSTKDLVGNEGLNTAEVGGTTTTVGYIPPSPTPTAIPLNGLPTPVLPTPVLPSNAPPKPAFGGIESVALPSMGPPPTPVSAPVSAPAPTAIVPEAVAPWTPPPAPTATSLPTPTAPVTPAPQVLATSAPIPTQEQTPSARVINFTKFDLAYQVSAGPSGISRVLLYVTRDEGKTWTKWSEHDGREMPLRVELDKKWNGSVEGNYGFRLVPESGARLADSAPAPGTAPEFRCVVDTTPPSIDVIAPVPHPTQKDAVVLKWRALDGNFGPNPMTFEYAETAQGPWRAVNSGDEIKQVVAGTDAGPPRMANTGEYVWRLPSDLSTHKVYLKVTAWDAAGNKREVMTRDPIQIDFTKPRATIQGIVAAPGR